ncbi:hypothetical protein B0T22DRAFT_161269 [Podospora appendiculata]|uniref:Uncharacterized protein n=1 Tax=Podospora appendiculata TaxID=314037 RepID=A0AAE0X9V1_9PEZI|nr:hypothetical protein B0T22DRAFT_161269 [Podospora appendiculata]
MPALPNSHAAAAAAGGRRTLQRWTLTRTTQALRHRQLFDHQGNDPSNNPFDNDEGDGHKLTPAAIFGIVFGIIVFIAIVTGICVFARRWQHRKALADYVEMQANLAKATAAATAPSQSGGEAPPPYEPPAAAHVVTHHPAAYHAADMEAGNNDFGINAALHPTITDGASGSSGPGRGTGMNDAGFKA